MDNATDILCDAVQNSYADGFLAKVYGAQCIVSLLAIPPAIAMCLAIGRASALHKNIRRLLVNFLIATILSNVGIMIVSGYHVWAVVSSNSVHKLCDMIAMTGRSCTRLQAVSSYGSFTIATSLIFLAIERICATVWFKTYENGGYRKLGIVLSVSQWIMSIPALPFLGEVNTRYPYCQSAVVRPRASQYFMACMLIAQITGLVIFVVLVIVNKRKMSRYFFNSALKLLSVRYQLKENIGTTKLMIPISIASAFLYAISLIIIIVLLEDLPDNAQLTTKIAQKMISFARWREMIGFAIPLHTFALCTVVVCYSSHIRQATIKLIGWNRRTIATSKSGRTDPTARNSNVEAEQTKKRYFDALKMQWESVTVSNQSKQQQCSLDVMASRKSHGSQKIAWDPQDTQL